LGVADEDSEFHSSLLHRIDENESRQQKTAKCG